MRKICGSCENSHIPSWTKSDQRRFFNTKVFILWNVTIYVPFVWLRYLTICCVCARVRECVWLFQVCVCVLRLLQLIKTDALSHRNLIQAASALPLFPSSLLPLLPYCFPSSSLLHDHTLGKLALALCIGGTHIYIICVCLCVCVYLYDGLRQAGACGGSLTVKMPGKKFALTCWHIRCLICVLFRRIVSVQHSRWRRDKLKQPLLGQWCQWRIKFTTAEEVFFFFLFFQRSWLRWLAKDWEG